jgi:pyrroline-5-carboxylate reductase
VSLEGKRIGFVGGGNMGEALIRGLLGTKTVPAALLSATDVRTERTAQLAKQFGITAHGDNLRLVRETDVVVLAVKPQIMATVVAEIAPAVTARHLLISIAAGVSTAAIGAALGKEARIVRVMPNTPALVLQGAAAVAKGRGQEAEDLAVAEAIFGAVGRVVVLDESLMDAVTGLSGSGPAYVALVVEALADGGVNMGLDRATALTLATQTVLGAAQLLVETGMHPAVLKDMVSSPGGTTIAGITALEDGGLRATLIRAVERATVRSRELGRGSAR